MPQARKTAPQTVATTDAKSASSSTRSSTQTTKLETKLRGAATTVAKTTAGPSREAIAHRAYELYLQRGSESGFELEDWLAAEAELTAEAALAAGNSDASR